MNEYHQLHILIEYRTFLSALERTLFAGLDRMFLSGLYRPLSKALRLEI